MEWVFINKRTLKEKHSGYIIELVSGSWRNPMEVRPVTPRQAKFIRQAELLRRGLEFAYETYQDHIDETGAA